MGVVFAQIDDRLAEFMCAQHVFFVGSAPLGPQGHVNVSPKGLDSFRVLGPRRVAYLDLVGSGVETVAHLRENGRICFMFCAFEGPPRIVRLHGRGRVIEPGDAEWNALLRHFDPHPGARAILLADLDRIADSCGYGVPRYSFEAARDQLDAWVDRKGEEGLRRYRAEHCARSLDGLPGLRTTGGPAPTDP